MSSRAAALPTIDLTPPRALIGKSTVDAIRAGVLYGFAGMVDGIIGRLHDELGEFQTLATGGLAGARRPALPTIDEADDLLTLTGLRIIWERNSVIAGDVDGLRAALAADPALATRAAGRRADAAARADRLAGRIGRGRWRLLAVLVAAGADVNARVRGRMARRR